MQEKLPTDVGLDGNDSSSRCCTVYIYTVLIC